MIYRKRLISSMATATTILFLLTACQEKPKEIEPAVTERNGQSLQRDSLRMDHAIYTNGMAIGPTVDVRLTESTIEMSTSISGGPTTFSVTNTSNEEHSFKIEGQGVVKEFDSNLLPGESRTLQVDLEPGAYKISDPTKGRSPNVTTTALTVTERSVEGPLANVPTEFRVDVRLTDAAVEMPTSIAGGQKTFIVTNTGDKDHNFKIEGPSVSKAFASDLKPGETKHLEVNLKPGTYTVTHPIKGQAGLSTTLTVTKPAVAVSSEPKVETLAHYSETPKPKKETSARRKSGQPSTGTNGNVVSRVTAAVVEVKFTEATIEMPVSVRAGQKTLKVTNTSNIEHDFRITGNGIDEALENVKPGESKTLKLDLKSGTYQVTRGATQDLVVTQEDSSWSTAAVSAITEMARTVDGGSVVEFRLTQTGFDLPVSTMAGVKTLKVTNATNFQQNFKIAGNGIDKEFVSLKPGETRIVLVDLQSGVYDVTCSAEGKTGLKRTLTIAQ